jgi:FG-GAP-like repeat
MLAILLALNPAAEPAWISFIGGPRSITRVGDVNADGVPDLAVGDPGAVLRTDPVEGNPTIVYSGKDGSVLLRIPPPPGATGFGRSIALWEDFDGDRRPDLAISACAHFREGASEKESAEEHVYVVSSKTGAILHSASSRDAGACFGFELACAGDLDGDGLRELIVGAPGSATVQLYSGKDMSLLRTLRGGKGETGFGASVASIADLDGDSVDDILIGVLSTALRGTGTVVISGKSGKTILTLEREANSGAFNSDGKPELCRFAVSVASAGDLDGDGKPDLIIGADHAAEGPGAVFLYSGKDLHRLDVLKGTEWAMSRFGASVASLGDVDGDGTPDIAASDPDDDFDENGKDGQSFGSVHAFSGRTRKLLWIRRGPISHCDLGYCIAPFDDLDGDGAPDLLVKERSPTGAAAWRCKVLSGKTGKVLLEVPRIESSAK